MKKLPLSLPLLLLLAGCTIPTDLSSLIAAYGNLEPAAPRAQAPLRVQAKSTPAVEATPSPAPTATPSPEASQTPEPSPSPTATPEVPKPLEPSKKPLPTAKPDAPVSRPIHEARPESEAHGASVHVTSASPEVSATPAPRNTEPSATHPAEAHANQGSPRGKSGKVH